MTPSETSASDGSAVNAPSTAVSKTGSSTNTPATESTASTPADNTDQQANNIALGVGLGVGIPAVIVAFCAWWFPRHPREKRKIEIASTVAEEKGKKGGVAASGSTSREDASGLENSDSNEAAKLGIGNALEPSIPP
jgi:hypothetical protein